MVGRRPSDTCGNGTPSNRQRASSIRSAPRRIGSRQLDLNYHSSLNSLRAPPLPERERVGERVFFLQEHPPPRSPPSPKREEVGEEVLLPARAPHPTRFARRPLPAARER